MFDLPTRLLIAYGLIALMVLAAIALAFWWRYNSPDRRSLRERERADALYRRRQQTAALGSDDRGTRS